MTSKPKAFPWFGIKNAPKKCCLWQSTSKWVDACRTTTPMMKYPLALRQPNRSIRVFQAPLHGTWGQWPPPDRNPVRDRHSEALCWHQEVEGEGSAQETVQGLCCGSTALGPCLLSRRTVIQ